MTSDGENLKWKSDFSKGNHPKRTPSEFSQKFLIRCRTPRPRSLSSSRLPTVGGAQGRKIRNELGKETVGGFVVCQLLMDVVVSFSVWKLIYINIMVSEGFR